MNMSYEYYDSLNAEAKSRYSKKLEIAQLKECPYRLPAGEWKDDTTLWPNIHYGDIYDYLINSPGEKYHTFTTIFFIGICI